MNKKIAIVAVGYNRIESLKRLLDSLEKANYDDDNPELIISLDKADCLEIESMAEGFQWSHGRKRVVKHPIRLGLKKHILECGQYLDDFDAVVILEDDVIVSPWYYIYTRQTVDFYYNDDRIAGISLYNYGWNEFVNYPFEAAYSSYDVYFLQLSQSWGQVWMRNQWHDFISWLQVHENDPIVDNRIPDYIWGWKSSSWKKYHIMYCVQNNKFFVQPYKSFSTCFSEIGEHCSKKNTMLQVQLYDGDNLILKLPRLFVDKAIVYDVFFERKDAVGTCGDIQFEDCCFDLYGNKREYDNKRYVISTSILPYLIIRSFGLELKPQEMNVIMGIEGEDIFLYDTAVSSNNKKKNKIAVYRYRQNNYDHTMMQLRCVLESIKTRMLSYFKKN